MNSKEVTKEMQKLSSELVRKERSGGIPEKDIQHLRDVLQFHEHRYYILNEPLLSDQEYDNLFTALRRM